MNKMITKNPVVKPIQLRWPRLLFAFSLLAVSGCFTSYTKPIATPKERNTHIPYAWSQLPSGGTASLGDRLFWVRRYVSGAKEIIAVQAPAKLKGFPSQAQWFHSHVYEGEDAPGAAVYTTKEYYNGAIGVIVDSEDKLVTRKPAVQVSGSKKGRRWSLPTGKPFFVIPDTLIEAWGVRYGGRKGTSYVFEIVDMHNPNASQITQSLEVTPNEFTSGFTVRGVVIKGLEDMGAGIIKYSLNDNRVAQ